MVCACGGPPLTGGSPPPSTVAIVPPRLPRAEFAVAPAELNDPGILDRIQHRTRLRRFGSAWIREDEADPTRTRYAGSDTDHVLPVIGESRTRIRVAFEDDNARLAMWIAREDTWPVAAVSIELSDGAGNASRDAGVFASRGAPLALAEREGDRRAVRVLDELLELRGYVPDSVIANVWLAGPGDKPASFSTTSSTSWETPPDLRTHVRFLIETKIRSAPDGKSRVIAVVEKPDVIGVIANNLGEYRQVEIARPYARVLGYVAASEVSYASSQGHGSGTGTGHGFGMSHADRIDVPAGTCLFDRADGEVVGVQSEPTTRLGRRARDGDKWSLIHVGTRWTVADVYIHDESDDPTQPRWESCTRDAHR